ncbi:ankyrin repeat-containing domain protein [Stachybotrys elegans]|uniref:Ankyrin repeat-containing domain protein n=1 Tax=Stachybotrys elegans TaxID=80388 RepID=A0A8K0SMQ2_9HYPO|nr:ankyrin repeat-containing domain protein [Stachybotrys elegans]
MAALSNLWTLYKRLPGRLHAVSNEVADLELVLTQARSKLRDAAAIVDRLNAAVSASPRIPLLAARAWHKEHATLQSLQNDIRTIKSSLNILLGASNSYDMVRIRLDIQEATAVTLLSAAQSSKEHSALGQAVLDTMAKIDERVARVEDLVRTQSDRLHAREFSQIGPLYSATAPEPPRRPISSGEKAASVGVAVYTSPSLLDSILGRIFIGYSGLPALSPNCDNNDCRGPPAKQVSVEYWFPASIWSAILRVHIGFALSGGPSLHLETLRNGLASPRDVSDTRGYTLLRWALYAKQYEARRTTAPADPNIMDVQISGPLSNAGAQGYTTCVELLLEAGADPDPSPPNDIKKGSPLSVATRNGKDATLLKRLLDFGADPDTLTAENQTPLFHATKNDNASFAVLLLEHGANINALSSTGETPLTTAIKCNSHNTLRLFLERWSEYSVCPRLRGPNLLEIAALYGDCETLAILSATDHLRSSQDKNYTVADFKTLLRRRIDVNEELIGAFDKLLSVINMAPYPG